MNPAVLRRLWQHETLLFLGCSLEKDYLVERMLQLSGENRRIHHYAVVEWPQLPERQQEREGELLRLKIRPIWYPQGGPQLRLHHPVHAGGGQRGSQNRRDAWTQAERRPSLPPG